MADVQPLSAQLATLLPGITPTALQPIVASALATTVQSPLTVVAPQPLPVGLPRPQPPVNHTKLYLGIGGGVIGLGLVAWLLMRKRKGRK